MDTIGMTFDGGPTRRAFPDLPNTGVLSALKELLTGTRPQSPSAR